MPHPPPLAPAVQRWLQYLALASALLALTLLALVIYERRMGGIVNYFEHALAEGLRGKHAEKQGKFAEIALWTTFDRVACSRQTCIALARTFHDETTRRAGVQPQYGLTETGTFVALWDCGEVSFEMSLGQDQISMSGKPEVYPTINWTRITKASIANMLAELRPAPPFEQWLAQSGWGGQENFLRALWRRAFPRQFL